MSRARVITREILRQPLVRRAARLSGSSRLRMVHVDELGNDPIARLRTLKEELDADEWVALYELGPTAITDRRRCLVAAWLLHAGFGDLMQEVSVLGALSLGRR